MGSKTTIDTSQLTETTRLDSALATLTTGLSRTRIKHLILNRYVLIDGNTIDDPSKKINAGALVELYMPEPQESEVIPEKIELSVVFEDDHIIVIDKPAGLVVHTGPGHSTGTLVNALLHHCGSSLSGVGGVLRPGIVHRLDKDTSGIMVAAKSDVAHRNLADQFADHGRSGFLERIYLALVWGRPNLTAGTIDTFVGRSKTNREKKAVCSSGRRAITHYKVLETFRAGTEPIASLIECKLETGRTHQIRLHMAHIGHPILGDKLYGAGFITKANMLKGIQGDYDPFSPCNLVSQALHAHSLAFLHPVSDERVQFESKVPEYMTRLLERLHKYTTTHRRN